MQLYSRKEQSIIVSSWSNLVLGDRYYVRTEWKDAKGREYESDFIGFLLRVAGELHEFVVAGRKEPVKVTTLEIVEVCRL